VFAVLSLVALVACGDQPIRLADAPTLYAVGRYPAAEVPVSLRRAAAPILYVTDRARLADGSYGVERSDSMAFGQADVSLGDFASWEALVAASQDMRNLRERVQPLGYDEFVRFPATPLPARLAGARPVPDGAAAAAYAASVAAFQRGVAARLAETPRKEVIVYIHGFNSELDDALATTASLWHYAGRIGVPITYSWPAGNRGLTAYLKDREAGEFTVFHLKEFLRALAGVPGLQAIQIVAHSRGADVTTSALREMVIAENAAGRDPRATLKLRTLILAAPDLDYGVVRQRLAAEGTVAAAGSVTIYLNPSDGALGIAQAITTGTRIGRLRPEDFTDEDFARIERYGNAFYIDVEGAPGRLGHTYFRDNPAVLSDVVLTLRTGARPGDAARPLEPVRGPYWKLHANYPGPRILREVRRNDDR
jgi:esterase/lipase superfamily enzyme